MMIYLTLDQSLVNIRVVAGQDSETVGAKVHSCWFEYPRDVHVRKRPSLKHLSHRDARDSRLQGTRVQSPVAS